MGGVRVEGEVLRMEEALWPWVPGRTDVPLGGQVQSLRDVEGSLVL